MATNSGIPRVGSSILATLLVTGTFSGAFGHEPQSSLRTKEPSIAELLQSRRVVLSELAKLKTEAYRMEQARIESVIEPHRRLLEVELELAVGHNQRAQFREAFVHFMVELESIARAKYKERKVALTDVLVIQAERLRVEIDLLRERRARTED